MQINFFHRFYSSGFGYAQMVLDQFWEFRRSARAALHFSGLFLIQVEDQTDSDEF